jgi:hypothetical protein
MITIVKIYEAYTKPTRFRKATVNPKEEYSIYILPGNDDDFQEKSGEDYEDYVRRRGVLVAERLDSRQTNEKTDEIRLKFTHSGFKVKDEYFAND